MTEARVILALAAEADDDFIWSRLGDIQSNMFAAGPVSIKFAYFGSEGSFERRPFMSTRWATHAGDMQALIDHARDRCVCGCYVNIGDVLVEALKETEQGSIQAVVIIGVVTFDPMMMVAGLAALLGGIVVFGSNTSTANQLSEAMRSAESQRAALIDRLNICLVKDAPANRDGTDHSKRRWGPQLDRSAAGGD